MIKSAFMIGVILCLIFLCACNYSFTMVHTEGAASDVIDEVDTLSPSTTITANPK